MCELVFVMRMHLFADNAAVIEAAIDAQTVGKLDDATVRAGGLGSQGGFPVGPAVSLIRVAETLLGNWHGKIPLNTGDLKRSKGHKNVETILTKKYPAYKGEDPSPCERVWR
jgi:hypothetical protein